MSLFEGPLPELHRVRVKDRGQWTFDRCTHDAAEAQRWFSFYAESVAAGRVRGHISHSRNGMIDQWQHTPEGSA